MDIQKKLDEWLAENPDAQQYVTKLYYVTEGSTPPTDTTHTIVLASASSAERHLMIGMVVVPKYAAFLDLLLSMVATQPKA